MTKFKIIAGSRVTLRLLRSITIEAEGRWEAETMATNHIVEECDISDTDIDVEEVTA